METAITIDKFTEFALNYSMDFIRKAYSTLSSNIIDHLEIKFMECYTRHGGYGAMVAFWRELSINNRELLAEYITKTYKS